MKKVGVFTDDFSLYHDLVRSLRRRGVPFVSLDRDEPVPPSVGVILTSWGDFPAKGAHVPHISVPLDAEGGEDVEAGINEALKVLSGITSYRRLVIGIDPGDRPGIAFLGDGVVVHATQVRAPERVGAYVRRMLPQYPARERIVRVGHGARLVRNRILNALLPLASEGVEVEMVDETATTPGTPRHPTSALARDIQAAIGIGSARGRPVEHELAVDPLPGEISDLQRKSREASAGDVTISKQLAAAVARGDLTLDEAVAAQRQGPGLNGPPEPTARDKAALRRSGRAEPTGRKGGLGAGAPAGTSPDGGPLRSSEARKEGRAKRKRT